MDIYQFEFLINCISWCAILHNLFSVLNFKFLNLQKDLKHVISCCRNTYKRISLFCSEFCYHICVWSNNYVILCSHIFFWLNNLRYFVLSYFFGWIIYVIEKKNNRMMVYWIFTLVSKHLYKFGSIIKTSFCLVYE